MSGARMGASQPGPLAPAGLTFHTSPSSSSPCPFTCCPAEHTVGVRLVLCSKEVFLGRYYFLLKCKWFLEASGEPLEKLQAELH